MKKLFAALCLSVFMSGAAHAEEIYDPQHTMLALNMAIVSVHRILATQDRIILDQEYQNIINNLNLGNIKDDEAMTALYRDLTRIISRKQLRDEESKIIQARYERKEEGLLWDIVDKIIASDKNLIGFLENMAVSCVSSYFEYHDAKSELAEGLSGELWQLTREEITDCNNLQERLLNSSWALLRKYGLQDSYRLVQRTLDDFYKAVNEKDPAKRFRMLRAVERDFQVYPPYWMYRGKTAQALGNNSEAHSCFERFSEVWRPVLRQDPYKVEALKFGLSELVKDGNISDENKRRAFGILEEMTENTPRDDWANRIFEGVAYFSIGSRDKGIETVQGSIDFEYGVEMSKTVLNDFQLKDALIKYFEGNEAEAETILENLSRTSENPVVLQVLACINAPKNYVKFAKIKKRLGNLPENKTKTAYFAVQPLVESYAEKQVPSAQWFLGEIYGQRNNTSEAMKWYQKSAEHGFFIAQHGQGVIYYNNQNYAEAIKWLRLAADQGFALSQYNLGSLYEYGNGVKQNYSEAVNWYRKAADQGYAAAQNDLGAMYYRGYGIKQNLDEAARLFRLAAEQGIAEAQENLGNMYFQAKGEEQYRYKQAYFWYSLSVLFGRPKTENMIKIEGKKGFLWADKSLLPEAELNQAKEEARRKYDEIRKRYGLD